MFQRPSEKAQQGLQTLEAPLSMERPQPLLNHSKNLNIPIQAQNDFDWNWSFQICLLSPQFYNILALSKKNLTFFNDLSKNKYFRKIWRNCMNAQCMRSRAYPKWTKNTLSNVLYRAFLFKLNIHNNTWYQARKKTARSISVNLENLSFNWLGANCVSPNG